MNSASRQSDELNSTKYGWYENSVLFMLELSESDLFSGVFVPPPPRPIFLNGSVRSEESTCELCSWAWKRNRLRTTDASPDIPSQAEWVISLIVVSVISACLGAIGMMIFFRIKRSKNNISNESESHVLRKREGNVSERPPLAKPVEKEQISIIVPSAVPTENSVCCWLSKKSSSPSQLEGITSPVENHYTQMEETYNNEDTLYTELDIDDSKNKECRTAAELYQNQGFTDSDTQMSSAPSSAYYSDLSVITVPDQAYEVVNLATLNVNWDHSGSGSQHSAPTRLAAINENVTIPSDYV